MLKRFGKGLLGCCLIMLVAGCSSAPGNGSASNPGTSTGGPVSIGTDHATYAPTNSIHVTVKDQLSGDIYSLDTRASCTVLGLEQQSRSVWQGSDASRCLLARHAVPVKIGSGQVYTATIQPGVPGVPNGAFPVGTYRLVLTYADSPADLSSSTGMTTIYSAPLTVTGQTTGVTPTPVSGTPVSATPVSVPSNEESRSRS